MMSEPVLARSAATLQGFRISPGDGNYFACLFDPLADGVNFTMVVEIFEPGGRTPPNTHQAAFESFFVLAGTGGHGPGTAPCRSDPATRWCWRRASSTWSRTPARASYTA